MKLAVGPAWGSPFIWTSAVEAMLDMAHPDGWDVRWFFGKGWCPARRHTDLCEKALTWGADVLCFVGADQIHPPDLLPRLVARHAQGYEVVGALVPARGYIEWMDMKPFQPMAWRLKRGLPTVLLKYLKRPWFFETVQNDTYVRYANQDVNFVWRLQQEAQAKVWVDTTIQVGHLHPFVIDGTFQERFADWATPGVGEPDIAKFSPLGTHT